MIIERSEPVNTKTLQLPVNLTVPEYHGAPNVGPLAGKYGVFRFTVGPHPPTWALRIPESFIRGSSGAKFKAILK